MFFSRLIALAIALLSALALQSCSERLHESSAESTVAAQQWIEYLRRDASGFARPGAPQLEQDLKPHSKVRAESFELQAILQLVDGSALSIPQLNIGFIARMDRVALRPQNNEAPVDSAWRYTGIMRSTTFIDITKIDKVTPKQIADLSDFEASSTVQRMALDLAGFTDSELWIGKNRLQIIRINDSSDACNRTYHWEAALSAEQHIALDVNMTDCPQVQALGEFNSWGQSSVGLTGFLTTNNPGAAQISTAVRGTAWMRQSWGNFPPSGGAVVIDSLQLRLDDSRWLDVSRSKRQSGRGPRTVSATLRTSDSDAEDIEMRWNDSTDRVMANSGKTYPRSIQLSSAEHDLSLTVSVMNRFSESSDFGISRLQLPVIVEGTHVGSGFMSFYSLAH